MLCDVGALLSLASLLRNSGYFETEVAATRAAGKKACCCSVVAVAVAVAAVVVVVGAFAIG